MLCHVIDEIISWETSYLRKKIFLLFSRKISLEKNDATIDVLSVMHIANNLIENTINTLLLFLLS
jgi:hypothetical protein